MPRLPARVVLLSGLLVVGLGTPGGPVGTAAAHCQEGHGQLLPWEAGGQSATDARFVGSGVQIHLPDSTFGDRWFKVLVNEPGSVVVPDDFCVPADTVVRIYRGEGDELVGEWKWTGSKFRSDLPVLSEAGRYYINVDLSNGSEESYSSHISFAVGEPDPDVFDVSIPSPYPRTVETGEETSFLVTITKQEVVSGFSAAESYWGPFTDQVVVQLHVNGDTAEATTITMSAGQSTAVLFTYTFTNAQNGNNNVSVVVRPLWTFQSKPTGPYVSESVTVEVELPDTDGDGIVDSREEEMGTNRTDPDTDGDGLTDVREVNSWPTDPLVPDTDGDGLDDGRELRGPTDPLVADTDDDGLDDGREVEDLPTDPLDPDTDDDGLSDGREVDDVGSDPLVTHSDGDGLADGREVADLGTDPTTSDTDDDGIDDDAEVGSLPTNPTDPDTDGDGLDDGREVQGPTDPLVADTDDDGLDDGPEVRGGFDPLSRHSDTDLVPDSWDPAPARWLVPLGAIYAVVSLLVWGVLFPARW